MNVHINLDLGVTVSVLGDGGALEAVRVDFDAMNDVLAELVDGLPAGAQRGFTVARPCRSHRWWRRRDDDPLQLDRGASPAWSTATRLAAMSERRRDAEIAAVDRATAGVAHVVEHPGFGASSLLLLVRARSAPAPGDVMALLAAVRPTGP